MKKLNFLFLLSFLLMTVGAFAQEKFIPTIVREDNETIRAITKEVDSAGWIYFKDDIRLQATEFFTQYKVATGLKEADEMKLQKTWSDEFGEYRRYQQFHKDIKVYGAEFDEQIKSGRVEMVHGKLVEGLDTDVKHRISEAEALDAALAKIGAKSYTWQDEKLEQSLKTELANENATYFPKGELFFDLVQGEDLVKENYALVWQFEIAAVEPNSLSIVTVDAKTGVILNIRNNAKFNGPAVTQLYGTRTIDTQNNGTTNILRATDNERNIHTRRSDAATDQHILTTDFDVTVDITNTADNWGVAQSPTTSAHFAATAAWDFFRNTFNRKGMDNMGGLVRVLTTKAFSGNAQYVRETAAMGIPRDIILVGNLGVSTSVSDLDIIGHEFTHGIARSTANFGGSNQPGALDESFADIFGVMVERSVTTLNWTIGESFIPLGLPALRSLNSPASITTPCGTPPILFQGAGWVPENSTCGNDNGGIHHNCSIQNLWFFKLSQAIGVDKAARIAFRNLTVNMMSQSTFFDARAGALNAATALFGLCSNEYKETMNAWAAVGVGAYFTKPTANFPNMVCPGAVPFDLNAYSKCSNDVFSWYFPNNWSFTSLNSSNSIIRVTSIGTVSANTTATLAVSGSFSGQSYVNIAVNKKCSGATKTIATTNGINLYPNPALDKLQVQISNDFIDGYLHIYDVLGQEISNNLIQQTNTEIDVSAFNNGLYFCKIQKGEDSQIIKFTKL